jgi:hypothetical protein
VSVFNSLPLLRSQTFTVLSPRFADTNKKFTFISPSALKDLTGSSGVLEKDVEKLVASLTILRPDGSPRPVEESPVIRALKGEVIMNEEAIIKIPSID